MNPFDEVAPILAYLIWIPFVIAIIVWEWKHSEADRKRRRQQAADFDAQRKRWLDKKSAS